MIESFMGVMIVTMTEIKTVFTGDKVDTMSLMFAIVVFCIYFIFYCFTWSICFCEFIIRFEDSQEIIHMDKLQNPENEAQNQNVEAQKKKDEEKPEEPVFYEELLADLSKEPFAAFHVPLVLTRILVFTFLIVCFSSFSKGTVWLLFLILLSCQILYFIQTSKFRKFEWWPLHSIYVINEAFFLSFILVFGFMNSREDYEGYFSAAFLVFLIFVNTAAVIFFQMCGNYIQGKKVIKEIKEYLKEEEKPIIVKKVKPKRRKIRKELVYNIATFEIEPEERPKIVTVTQGTMTDEPSDEEIFSEPSFKAPVAVNVVQIGATLEEIQLREEPKTVRQLQESSEETEIEQLCQSDESSVSESHRDRMNHIGLFNHGNVRDIDTLSPPAFTQEDHPVMLRRPSTASIAQF